MVKSGKKKKVSVIRPGLTSSFFFLDIENSLGSPLTDEVSGLHTPVYLFFVVILKYGIYRIQKRGLRVLHQFDYYSNLSPVPRQLN